MLCLCPPWAPSLPYTPFTQVESLLSERQQLTLRCGVLQKDNDQLAELVGRLMRTLQVRQVT